MDNWNDYLASQGARHSPDDTSQPADFGRTLSVADLAGLYGLPAQDIENWQASRILVMDHHPDGTLVRVISKDGGQILSPPPEEPALMQPAVPW